MTTTHRATSTEKTVDSSVTALLPRGGPVRQGFADTLETTIYDFIEDHPRRGFIDIDDLTEALDGLVLRGEIVVAMEDLAVAGKIDIHGTDIGLVIPLPLPASKGGAR